MTYYLAIDIGASSGRHILSHIENERLVLEEIYRFDNNLTQSKNGLVWDIESLFSEVLNGIKMCKKIGKIPKNMNCSAILKTNEHLCSKCRRCHALSFENGGCQKILDEFYSDKTFKKEYRIKVITAGKRIEKYDFITLGFQTFNQDDAKESFGVMNCDFFELEE